MADSTHNFENVYGEFLPAGQQLASPPPGEEVVISGISGYFPESDGLYEFQRNLLELGDLITEDDRRWKGGSSNTPHRMGKVPHPEKFDASFFEVDANVAYTADPVLRMQLETTYEAIIDAGVHPRSLKGKKIAVIVNGLFSESEILFDKNHNVGERFLYCNHVTQAAIIAHWLGVYGPVYKCDTACSSSLFALDAAYQFIRTGQCEAAIVSGGHLSLQEFTTSQFNNLGVLSPDGRCKTFDESADGYVRSEAVATIFLQKAKDARRMYGKLVHVQTNCDGYKPEGITFPSTDMQEMLLRRFYSECCVDPYNIKYMEAHGTGTKVGDNEELKAIDNVFTSKRTRENPLLIGSVKSNAGHSEPMSGLTSIAKVIISTESGIIPPNINYKVPRASATALTEGRIKVLVKPEPYPGGPTAISSFGFGGSNGHTLLAPNEKKKINKGAPKDGLPRLVAVSGRTPKAVRGLLNFVESMKPVDAEYTNLLHEVYKKRISGHLYRGYTVVPVVSGCHDKTVQLSPREKKITVKVFLTLEGATCNPAIIGSLMQFSIFSTTMNECSQALVLEGVDLLFAAFSSDSEGWSLRNSITTSAQIGLINLLRAVGVQISEYIGNCPARNYAEGKYNMEDAVRAAYDLDVEEHTARSISNMLSTDEKHTCPTTGRSSEQVGDIITNNTKDSEAHLKEVIVLEISPVSKLSESLNVFSNCHSLLQILGRLYTSGMDLHLTELYQNVEYPVSCGTPMIAPFIEWDHSEDWFVSTGIESTKGEYDFTVDIKMGHVRNKYLHGHVVDGRNLFPATGYIITALQAFCFHNSVNMADATILCENVRFKRATNVPKDGNLRFRVAVGMGTHTFEIMEGGSIIVTGQFEVRGASMLSEGLQLPEAADGPVMSEADIYKELRLRGYNYSGLFRCLKSLDTSGSVGEIAWKDNWTAYMDNMLQTAILQRDTRNLYIPVKLDRILMDFNKHRDEVANYGEDAALPVYCWKDLNIVRSGGIEICGMTATPIARRPLIADPVIESYSFVPYHGQSSLTLEELLRVSVHVALENNPTVKNVKAVEVPLDIQENYLSTEVADILTDLPVIQGNLKVLGEAPSSDVPPTVHFENHSLLEESDCLLILGVGILSNKDEKFHSNILSALSDRGYIISKESPKTELKDIQQSMTLVMDCVANNGSDRIVVCKKKSNTSQEVKYVNVSEDDYSWLPNLKSSMKNGQQQVVIVAQGNNFSGIMGLTNCVRAEPGGGRVRCLFIKDPKAPKFDPGHKFYQEQLGLDLAVNVFEEGCWGSYRHLPLKPPQTVMSQHAYNVATVTGDLSSFSWLQGYISPARDNEEKGFVHIYYSALNFRDVMTATGRMSADVASPSRHTQDCLQGYEYSGRDRYGRRVMGMAQRGAVASVVIAPEVLIWEVPNNWSLAEAATVPCVYMTVIFAFFASGGSPKGQSILIHAGSGGVGQAAINYCLFHGCNVFTTVGTTEKKEFLLKTFPQLPETHIGNSRDTSFEKMVLDQTQGRGVDIVLNSLAEDKLLASVRCLAKGGRFLEIGKFDIANDNQLSAEFLARDASFHSIVLDKLFDYPKHAVAMVCEEVMQSIREGSIKPLIRTVFNVNEVEQAYRFIAAGKHIGKVLLEIRPEEKEKIICPLALEMETKPRLFCNPEHTYVIIGGLGGFGLELSDWMVLRRARKLVLTSRRGVTNGYQHSRIRTWESYGVTVHISTEDVTSEEGCYRLLEEANRIGPVGGIFNLAVDLHDAVLENQTVENFQLSAGPKAIATSLMDKLSQKMCPHLSLFVVFSSVSCGRGNAGQTNYGWSNSVMERICEDRRSKGLPAVAIQWGAVGDVGLVAKMQGDDKEFVVGGTLPQKITSCLSLLDSLLLQQCPVVASMVVAEKRGGLSPSAGLLEYVANVLGIKNLKTINHGASLAELGMDSMMAVEIKQAVEVTFEVFLTPEEVRSLTLSSLIELSKRSADEKEKSSSSDSQAQTETSPEHVKNAAPILKLEGMKPCKVISQQCLPGKHNVYVIPGIDGDPGTMSTLSSRLHAASTKCLQTGFYESNEYHSISEIAQHFLPCILEDLSKVPTFAIVAFSFGGLVAVELITLLEARGYKGPLILIDSSPKFLRKSLEQLGEEYDSVWLAEFLPQMGISQSAALEFQKKAGGLEWSKKLDIALDFFPNPEIRRNIQVRLFLTTIRKRLNDVINYKFTSKRIQSEVTLIKRTEDIVTDIDPSFGLNEICQNIVGIHSVPATHYTIAEDAKTAEIVNEQLERWCKV